MTPNVPPLRAPSAPSAPQSSFRDMLRTGKVQVGDATPTVHTKYTTDDQDIIIRIPKKHAFNDLRTKEEHTNDDGKRVKASATLVISAIADERSDLTMAFVDNKGGNVLKMTAKPSININVGLNWRDIEVEPLPASE